MPTSFRVTSKDESNRVLWLCHVCFSTLLSQHRSICTRLNLKIQENAYTKSGGGSSYNCRGSAAIKIFQTLDRRKFDWIKRLGWKFGELLSVWKPYKLMAIEKLQTAPICENIELPTYFISFVPHWGSTFYIKHKIFLCFVCWMYSNRDLCSCLCWRRHFSPGKSQLAKSKAVLSSLDGKLRVSRKTFSLWSLKSAAIKIIMFSSAMFSQNDARSSKSDRGQCPEQLLVEKLGSDTHQTVTFCS